MEENDPNHHLIQSIVKTANVRFPYLLVCYLCNYLTMQMSRMTVRCFQSKLGSDSALVKRRLDTYPVQYTTGSAG